MRTSATIGELATALSAAQAEMPNAIFNRTNPHFKSKYADLAAIREATLPALTKHGLSILQTTMFVEHDFYLFSRLMHNSGEWIEGEFPIQLGSPQSMGSQLTYFKRYLWSGMTGVAADDDDDANSAQAAAEEGGGGVTGAVLGVKTLPKARSRPIYMELTAEMRACTSRDALSKWAYGNTNRIYSMHPDFQRFFREDYQNHLTAVTEGVNEKGEIVRGVMGEDTTITYNEGTETTGDEPEPGSSG